MSKITDRYDERYKAFKDEMEDKFTKYRRYARWFKGDYTDLADSMMAENPAMISTINMVGLVGRAFRAHLFFRHPQINVKPSFSGNRDLARVLTLLGNDIFQESGMYWTGRKLLQDGFLAPYMVAKVGYNLDVVADEQKIRDEEQRAAEENARILAGMTVPVRADDYHLIHIERHELLWRDIQDDPSGENYPATDQTKNRLKDHIERHYKRLEEVGTPTNEVERGERVFIRRKRPDWVFFDLWAPHLEAIQWVGETVLRPLEEVKKDPRYNTNRNKVQATDLAPIQELLSDKQAEFYGRDGVPRVALREVVDLKDGSVITYPVGEDFVLREVEYKQKRFMPSGPYVFGMFDEDPEDEGVGISQPTFWEDQQKDISVLNTVEVLAAKSAIPGMAYDANYVADEEVESLYTRVIGRYIKLTNLEDRKVGDVITDIPTPKITPETFAMGRKSMEVIERASMMGATRLGGGDRTRTATASALVSESISALTQAAAIMVDKMMLRIASYALRLAKAYYRRATVQAVAGDLALEVWPEEGFTTGEILDDRGVEIVVGTMRRQSTDVELKLMGDLYLTMAKDPGVPLAIRLKLLDHLTNLYGAPIDLGDYIEAAERDGGSAAGAPPGGAPGGGVPRTADLLAGLKNLGGGRLPTGASAGDGQRIIR